MLRTFIFLIMANALIIITGCKDHPSEVKESEKGKINLTALSANYSNRTTTTIAKPIKRKTKKTRTIRKIKNLDSLKIKKL